MLYSASCKQPVNYYNEGYDKQQPNYGSKIEDEKAQKPQQNKDRSNYD